MTPCSRRRPPPGRRDRTRCRSRRCPVRSRTRRCRNPPPRAQRNADAAETHSTSPSRHAPTATDALEVPALAQDAAACPRARPAARRPRAGRTRRERPFRCPRRPARPGCGGSSRRPGIPPSVVGSVAPLLSVADRATGAGVYGSFIDVSAGLRGRSRPRVRFTYSTSKPPDPSSSSRACVLTITSSPSATGPVSRGYATQGRPSTSTRERPFDALDDRGHPAASKCQHLERRRRARASLRPSPRGPRR